MSSAVAWKLTATGPMWHRQANCSRHARQRQRRNGRQWWNGALLERQVLLLMRIGDTVVLACLTHDAMCDRWKCRRLCLTRFAYEMSVSKSEVCTSVERSSAVACSSCTAFRNKTNHCYAGAVTMSFLHTITVDTAATQFIVKSLEDLKP